MCCCVFFVLKVIMNKRKTFYLPNNEKISFITCGYYHTICLTENNLCYVWGWNYFGQLGLGHTNNFLIPLY